MNSHRLKLLCRIHYNINSFIIKSRVPFPPFPHFPNPYGPMGHMYNLPGAPGGGGRGGGGGQGGRMRGGGQGGLHRGFEAPGKFSLILKAPLISEPCSRRCVGVSRL